VAKPVVEKKSAVALHPAQQVVVAEDKNKESVM